MACKHNWVRDSDFIACTNCYFVTHNTKKTREWIDKREETIEVLPLGGGVYQTLAEDK